MWHDVIEDDDEMWHVFEDDDDLSKDNDPICDICGETLSECECTDADAYEAYGDYDESGG